MSGYRFVIAGVLLLASVFSAAAQDVEPQIYYFGAAGCDFCDHGLAYIKKMKADDERVSFRAFDIVTSPDDATVFVRLVSAIGLTASSVPMTIIGHHVIIGYQDDETTGKEISRALEQCRATLCTDLVHGLLTYGGEMASGASTTWTVDRRFANAALPR
jgi:hypothetical protein